jgi:hypothetical protein
MGHRSDNVAIHKNLECSVLVLSCAVWGKGRLDKI